MITHAHDGNGDQTARQDVVHAQRWSKLEADFIVRADNQNLIQLVDKVCTLVARQGHVNEEVVWLTAVLRGRPVKKTVRVSASYEHIITHCA